tara:strand:- start:5709 stop:7574 length:1866 start_codon:yes stop_codon:yes gene_type:complete
MLNLDGVINSLVPQEENTYEELKRVASEETNAVVEKVGKAPGVNSIFNAFNVFRYSKFGLNQNTYDTEKHFDYDPGQSASTIAKIAGANLGESGDTINNVIDKFKPFTDTKQFIENPTASQIIQWAKQNGSDSKGGVITPTPYTSTDFIWCKYYGKVPNNRMVTLRRYPIPVEDNLLILADKSPLVPLAQAVTWYGKDIQNPLNEILNLNWGFNWKPRTADVTDVTGNEIQIDDILAAINVKKGDASYDFIRNNVFGATGEGGTFDMAKLSGFDAKIQKYIKDSYGANGPYWNQVLGPVNVINSTLVRERGFTKQSPVKMQFDYSLRSYGGINPKIAFLDLLTNFLSLTYNSAPFWGGDIRYFEKTGVTVDGLSMEKKMLKGDVKGSMVDAIAALNNGANGGLNALKELLTTLGGGAKLTAKQEESIKQFGGSASNPLNQGAALYAGRLGKLFRDPLSYRAVLDGRAVGEWHVTVGNPMNPMATMGNLVVSAVDMKFGEVLGVDDFPTEFSFIVTLNHGRPRAKQDLESIFNMGNGRMAYTAIAEPSSARNSYGPFNTGKSGTALGNASSDALKNYNEIADVTASEGSIASYRSRVSSMYGPGFGDSPILTDYFIGVKTKD